MAYILKSGLLLAVFHSFYLLFMRKATFFRFNRIALLAGTFICLLLPLAHFSAGPVQDMIPHLEIPALTVGTDSTQPGGRAPGWPGAILIVYLSGGAIVLGLSILALVRTMKMTGRGERTECCGYTVRVVEQPMPSFSFLGTVVISREDYERHPFILQHELQHLKAHHSMDILLFSALCAFQWFNPLVWIVRSELRMLHEYEADEALLKLGIDAAQYQLLLVKKAVGVKSFQMANGFNHTKLKNRITIMQSRKTNSLARLGYVACTPLLLGALCFCSGQQKDKPQQEETLDEVVVVSYANDSDAVSTKSSDEQAVPLAMLDESPKFNGEEANTFARWVNENLIYPESAKEANVQGRVMVSFKINSDGSLSDVEIIESAGKTLDNKVLRVIGNSPDWTAGKVDGKAVPCKMLFPVIFKLM